MKNVESKKGGKDRMPNFKAKTDIELLKWFKEMLVNIERYALASEIRNLEKKITEKTK